MTWGHRSILAAWFSWLFPVHSKPLLWALIILAALVFPRVVHVLRFWIIGPLLAWRKPFLSTEPQVVATEADQLTPEMKDFLSPLLPQFSAEGFEVVGNFQHRRSGQNVTGFQLLLVNRRSSETATILLVQAQHRRNFVFAFSSQFTDGFEIQTGVNRDIGFSPRNPQVDSMTAAWVSDVATIHELHRRRVRHLGREGDPSVAPAPGTELAALTEDWHREGTRLERCGYCYLDELARTYRKTLKGAYLIQWKLLPPIVQWRTRLRDRRARRMWCELGMDDWMARQPQKSDAFTTATDAQPIAATAADSPSDPLRYELALREGEIRQERTVDSLVVRMGRQSLRSYLREHWISIFFMLFYVALIGQTVYRAWMWHLLVPYLPLYLLFPRKMLGWLALILCIFAFQAIRFVRGLAYTGGTVVLVASSNGLRFTNPPDRRREGHILRQDLRGLFVVLTLSDSFRRWYRLVAVHRDGKQVLLAGKDRQMLLDTRSALASALGIELKSDVQELSNH